MCGIFLIVCDQSNPLVKRILQNETIHYYLSRRGPDHFEKITVDHQLTNDGQFVRLTFLSSVLQLRGCFVCNQPVKSVDGSILQWNGQIFNGFELNSQKSDTEQLMSALSSCDSLEQTVCLLSKICGPWAFTYWDNRNKRLYVGRDVLGRRSLCWNNNRNEMLIVSSIAHVYNNQHPSVKHSNDSKTLNEIDFEEIPSTGIYCFDFATNNTLPDVLKNVLIFQWNRTISGKLQTQQTNSFTISSPISVELNQCFPENTGVLNSFKNLSLDDAQTLIPDSVVDQFEKILSQSVLVRCGNHQNVCRKCFSRYVKHNEKKLSLTENGFDFTFYSSEDSDDEMRSGMATVNGITFRECSHSSIAILFSGGIDSTIIALLADKFVPKNVPIDLLNVAFCNDAPDRETGLSAWEELRELSPQRKWNFVSIHISEEELESYRAKHIRYLVKPLQTYLDDSIGCAVWFATRGKGLLLQEQGGILAPYQTRARVVLLGMGADEQLGGYMRYRKAYASEGYKGLLEQIAKDLDRISSRNLGRDDRITADHGMEARFPFLDENVVNYLNSLPIWHKCNLNLERGKGEKLLLRLLAKKLGLTRAVFHEKRAIQFGSRIAKLELPNVKADMICTKLVN